MRTPKEFQILDFIRGFIARHSYSPTVAEIAKGVKLGSRGTVYRYLKALETDGHITLETGKQRNIELTPKGWSDSGKGFKLPLLGNIAAGRPIEAILTKEEVDFGHLLSDDRYVLKICGDSMVDEGIYDGDLVICQHASRANNGDIVVALIDNAFATLKTFYKAEKNKIMLKPANKRFQPVTYEPERITIQGIMMGLLRLPR